MEYKHQIGDIVYYKHDAYFVMKQLDSYMDKPAYRLKSDSGKIIEIITEDYLTTLPNQQFKREWTPNNMFM